MNNKVGNAESQGILNQLIDDLYTISKEIKNEEIIINDALNKIYNTPPDLSKKDTELQDDSTVYGRLINLSTYLNEYLSELKDIRIRLCKLVK